MKEKARYVRKNALGENIPARISKMLQKKAARKGRDIVRVIGGGNTIVDETIYEKLTKENQNNVS